MSAAGTGQAAAPMQVPMLDLQAQYRPIRDAIVDVVTRVCDSQRFIMGPEVEAMELLVNRLKKTRSNAEFLMSMQG